MSLISNSDFIPFADSACSGTAEEADLLAAHLGIYDHHVTTFTAYKEELAYLEWEAESSIYDEKYDELQPFDERDLISYAPGMDPRDCDCIPF